MSTTEARTPQQQNGAPPLGVNQPASGSPPPPSRNRTAPILAAAALSAVVIACAVLILGLGGSGYTIHALFENSGQLVAGGEVQVAGRSVGSIAGISVTPNGLADVALSISDKSIVPLRQGTRAIIRTVGQAGVANRFVQLSPGSPTAPALRAGTVLPTTQTTGIVDLDAVLNTFDPATRASIQQLIAHGSQVFAGSGSEYFNRMLSRLDPALVALDSVSGQIANDRVALGQLVKTGAVAANAVASRSPALEDAVAHTASALGAIATKRVQLADLLQRAPAVLGQAGGTLRQVATAVTTLRPTLREIVPVAGPLKRLLTLLPPTLHQAAPVVGQLTDQLPDLRATLAGLRPLRKPAVAALSSTAKALKVVMPVLAGVREYGADFFLGVFNGLAGISTGNYNSTGHYVHLEFVQPYQTFFSGLGTQLLTSPSLSNNLFAERTGLTSRCPGANEPPAPDGSNPWVIPGLCNPADSMPLSVNFP
jgi:phospholipid/cholesterol/gamma-HCH transport system substrate-binding protein